MAATFRWRQGVSTFLTRRGYFVQRVSETIQRLAKRETTNQSPSLSPQPREGTNFRGG
jgi:hypothetical protein